ncbi:MAG TPA: hypothetical protein VMA83_01725 [Solirubrobacteraceae bacterium]|nr:hypothetical protein [Solirubrobacteraceae bacterium]
MANLRDHQRDWLRHARRELAKARQAMRDLEADNHSSAEVKATRDRILREAITKWTAKVRQLEADLGETPAGDSPRAAAPRATSEARSEVIVGGMRKITRWLPVREKLTDLVPELRDLQALARQRKREHGRRIRTSSSTDLLLRRRPR